MASRLTLHDKLSEYCENLYYQSPGPNLMEYPAIKYSKTKMDDEYADDIRYLSKTRYELKFIDYEPENPAIEQLLELPYCSYDREYTADNLHHTVLIIYW